MAVIKQGLTHRQAHCPFLCAATQERRVAGVRVVIGGEFVADGHVPLRMEGVYERPAAEEPCG